MPKSILLVGSLISNSFVTEFVDYILSQTTDVYALWTPSSTCERIPQKLASDTRIHMFYGATSNQNLVQKIVKDYKVDTVYHFNQPTPISSHSIIDSARQVLLSTTHLLEALRRCESVPFIFEVFQNGKGALQLTDGGRIEGTSRANSLSESNFVSAVAFLHSYAISYQLKIRVIDLTLSNEATENNDVLSALYRLPDVDEEGAALISTFSVHGGALPTNDSDKVAARFLIYGSKGWIAKQLTEYLDLRGIEHVESNVSPTLDSHDKVLAELLDVAPSHVICAPLQAIDDAVNTLSSYNNATPNDLLNNFRDNLYGPLYLASVCERNGIHFTHLGTKSLSVLEALLRSSNNNLSIAQNGERDRFSTMEKFTDMTLKFFCKSTLNVVVESAKGKAVKEALKRVVDATLQKNVGEFSALIDL